MFPQITRPLANSLESGTDLALVDASNVGHKTGHGFSMPRDDNLLAPFHAVKQSPKRVFGFEGTHFGKRRRLEFHFI
jgi:hypothetical protein